MQLWDNFSIIIINAVGDVPYVSLKWNCAIWDRLWRNDGDYVFTFLYPEYDIVIRNK